MTARALEGRLSARALAVLWALALAFTACASEPDGGPPAPGGGDASPPEDPPSAVDARAPAPDGGAGDASARDAGDILGALSGACGVVAAEIARPTPAFVENALAFAAGEAYARGSLSPGGQRVFDAPNAGGSSGESEVMSFEILHYCDAADLLKTENEIGYQPPDDAGSNAITDILVQIGSKRVGVSVTRAYKPTNLGYTDVDARDLLTKKLEGVNRSTVRVLPADKWVKQVLHVFAATDAQADAVRRVYPTLDATLRADTIVVLTKTQGGGFLYCNPDPPLGSECP